ncbi:hypothetical protein GPALN_011282 [Globodera pallida]|nr:hypothetical protein GPALN_011282 [Globodera pallida]
MLSQPQQQQKKCSLLRVLTSNRDGAGELSAAPSVRPSRERVRFGEAANYNNSIDISTALGARLASSASCSIRHKLDAMMTDRCTHTLCMHLPAALDFLSLGHGHPPLAEQQHQV